MPWAYDMSHLADRNQTLGLKLVQSLDDLGLFVAQGLGFRLWGLGFRVGVTNGILISGSCCRVHGIKTGANKSFGPKARCDGP